MKRINLLKKHIIDKNVLDIGCVAHTWKNHNKKYWLHKNLKKYVKTVIGLDYLKDDVDQLNKLGYNIKYGNAEKFNLMLLL